VVGDTIGDILINKLREHFHHAFGILGEKGSSLFNSVKKGFGNIPLTSPKP
jgi:hypothetical protein